MRSNKQQEKSTEQTNVIAVIVSHIAIANLRRQCWCVLQCVAVCVVVVVAVVVIVGEQNSAQCRSVDVIRRPSSPVQFQKSERSRWLLLAAMGWH